ncbi:MAG: ZIP family metal transporter [Planctomycetota bacterium]
MDRFDWIVILNGLACAAGGLLPVMRAQKGEPPAAMHAFAAGTLLGTALIVLIPEAAESLHSAVGLPTLLGFVVLYLIDRILLGKEEQHGHSHTQAGHSHHLGILAIASFSVHTLFDGAALGVAGGAPEIGLSMVAGVLFHEVPAQYIFARLLVASGAPPKAVAAGVISLATLMILAAYLVRFLTESLPANAVPHGLGFAAGMFLFISTSELLPRVHAGQGGRGLSILFFLGGIGCALMTMLLHA